MFQINEKVKASVFFFFFFSSSSRDKTILLVMQIAGGGENKIAGRDGLNNEMRNQVIGMLLQAGVN